MADREKVIKGLNEAWYTLDKWNNDEEQFVCIQLVLDQIYDALELLKEQPELVRCKDCEYYNSEPDSHGDRCDRIHWSRGDDWYCADGVRKYNG